MSRRTHSLAAILTTALLATGCAGPGSESTSQDDGGPISVGAAVSKTGAYSVEGAAVRDGYSMWEQEVNNRGGIAVDGKKRKVTVKYYDDQSDPETSIKLTQRLISDDKVDFVFGPYSSGLTIATSAITKQYKKIMFAGGAASNSVFQQKNNYIFSPYALTSKYTVTGLDMLKAKGAKSIGILHSDDAAMLDIKESTVAYAKTIGLKVTGTQSVPAESNDIKGALGQLKASEPDVLVEAGTSLLGVLTARTLRDLAWAPETLMVQAPTEDAFIDQLGAKTAQGILAPTQWEPSVDYSDDFFGTSEEFTAAFRKKFDKSPSYLAAGAAAAGLTLQLAVEKAGTTATEPVRKALVDLKADTFFGPIDFSASGDASGLIGANLGKNMLTLQINDKGEREIVAPADGANGEFTPMKAWNDR